MDDDMLMDGLMERISFELGFDYSKFIDPATFTTVHRFCCRNNDEDFVELNGGIVEDLFEWYSGREGYYGQRVKEELEDLIMFEMKIKRDSRCKS